jgi:hypothetical protein
MYTTIEPRLIALLNNDAPSEPFTTSPSLELPPLHDPNILKASGRPLLLEPDASKRNGKPSSSSQLAPQHTARIASLDEENKGHKGNEGKHKSGKGAAERTLGSSSPQSLRKILDDGHENTAPASSKKRPVPENSKDDFVQLPQPPKKQKAAKQVVPPIIIGLFEPPPQAALFPPIASSSFHDSHGRNSLNTVPPKVKEVKETSRNDSSNEAEKKKATAKDNKKRKDVRARKKWTEEETNNLLLGVHKHGVGNWTDIIEDPAFSFNDRSGADLKDRFRTCCPAELRGKTLNSTQSSHRKATHVKSKSSLMSENILIEEDEVGVGFTSGDASSSKPHKSRAHRKKLEDLAQLGIEGPFRKSHRRERRPFSEEEDREILEGYNIHGPGWTRIQRDPRFHLQSRQPTDLRDRFRNKFPEKFRAEDKGKENAAPTPAPSSSNFQSSDGRSSAHQSSSNLQLLGQEADVRMKDNSSKEMSTLNSAHVPPMLHTLSSREGLRIQEIISSEEGTSKAPSTSFQPQPSLFTFKDNFNFSDQQTMDSSDNLPFTQSFDWNGAITAPFTGNIGEMDISRLLLDESWPEMTSSSGNGIGKEKQNQSFTDINSILTSSAETMPSGSSYLNMLGDTEPIVDMQDAPFDKFG